jgi:hypothetical protein
MVSAAQKLDVAALTDAEVDELAARLAKRARARRSPAPVADAPISETDRAHVRKMARKWGLVVKDKR